MRRTLPSMMALQCFEVAAKRENFTLAAAELNMTQGAVSRQIRTLELTVGQPLFNRERQRVSLTPAGRRYLRDIVPLLQRMEAATLGLRGFDLLEGSLNIGCYPTLGSRWLLPHLIAFDRAFDGLAANLITYLDNAAFDTEIVDIGIVQGTPPWPRFEARYLMPEDLAPIASPDLVPEPVDDVADLGAFRVLHHTTRPESWRIWFAHAGEPYTPAATGLLFSQYELIIEALLAGHGVAMMPLILVRRELDEGRLILAHRHVARTDAAYHLLIPNEKLRVPKIEAFRDWLIGRVECPST